MNKDEALKCIDISRKMYKAGDIEGALKYAAKSQRLCDTVDGSKWLSFLKSNPNKDEIKPAKEKKKPKVEETQRPYTPEQERSIKNILEHRKKGDLYGILGLEKGATDAEIKKQYRKLALRLHPDKCGAPKTDDAFKAISHAWTVLGDEEKKDNYDRFGIDGESNHGRRAQAANPFAQFHRHHHQRFHGAEIDPEELLRAFMGGQFGGTGFSNIFNRFWSSTTI